MRNWFSTYSSVITIILLLFATFYFENLLFLLMAYIVLSTEMICIVLMAIGEVLIKIHNILVADHNNRITNNIARRNKEKLKELLTVLK